MLRALRVLVKGRPVATLYETESGGSRLVYDLQRGDSVGIDILNLHGVLIKKRADTNKKADILLLKAISLCLGEHNTPIGVLPFFQHLTAEGRLRAQQAMNATLDPQDDFGLLAAYGRDCIGAVSVEPVDSEEPQQLSFDFLPPSRPPVPFVAPQTPGLRTISGVQDKLLAYRAPNGKIYPAGPTGPAPLIAKLPTAHLDDIVPLEALTMELARLLLGDSQVARSQLGFVEGYAGAALLVERFDRTPEPDYAPLRMEDFCQILAVPRGVDFSGKYNGDFEAIFAALYLFSAAPDEDRDALFRRLVAFALLGNTDCHLKNFALLERPEGMRLSPAYDVVATAIYAQQGFSTRFGLRINGAVRAWAEVDRPLLTDLGRRVYVPDSVMDEAFATMAARWPAVLAAARPTDHAPAWRHKLWAVLNEAGARLLGL